MAPSDAGWGCSRVLRMLLLGPRSALSRVRGLISQTAGLGQTGLSLPCGETLTGPPSLREAD